MRHRILYFALILITLIAPVVQAQEQQRYDFIKYNANHLRYDSTSRTMRTFFNRWHRMAARTFRQDSLPRPYVCACWPPHRRWWDLAA